MDSISGVGVAVYGITRMNTALQQYYMRQIDAIPLRPLSGPQTLFPHSHLSLERRFLDEKA